MTEKPQCSFCASHFDFHYWTIPLDKEGRRTHGSFCTPECMLGYNAYINDAVCDVTESDYRLALIKTRYPFKRSVAPAPVQGYRGKIPRDVWLSSLRGHVTDSILLNKEWLLTHENKKINHKRR